MTEHTEHTEHPYRAAAPPCPIRCLQSCPGSLQPQPAPLPRSRVGAGLGLAALVVACVSFVACVGWMSVDSHTHRAAWRMRSELEAIKRGHREAKALGARPQPDRGRRGEPPRPGAAASKPTVSDRVLASFVPALRPLPASAAGMPARHCVQGPPALIIWASIPRSEFFAGGTDSLARSARIVPVKGGLRIHAVRPRSLWARAGLVNGDVIARVAGVRVDEPAAALEAYERLRRRSSFSIEICRQGLRQRIRVRLRAPKKRKAQ